MATAAAMLAKTRDLFEWKSASGMGRVVDGRESGGGLVSSDCSAPFLALWWFDMGTKSRASSTRVTTDHLHSIDGSNNKGIDRDHSSDRAVG